jgi:hypothetical protein
MAHVDIYKIFKTLFPLYMEKVTEYFPNGKNSIRVRIGELHQDFIFTFINPKEWKFETVDSFINNTFKK